MPRTQDTGVESRPGAGPEFDLTRAWADSKYAPSRVYQIWHALYKAYGSARQQFPDVDWISLIAILDVIAMAGANRRRVDISYLAAEMRWPRTTALRRLQGYAEMGYLTLTREGRHTYVDNTLKSRRAALKMIDVVIDSIDGVEPHKQRTQGRGVDGRGRAAATMSPRTGRSSDAGRFL